MPEKPYNLMVVDRQGNRIADLPDAQLDSATWQLNGAGEIKYSMAKSDVRAAVPQLCINEVQLYVPGTADPIQWAFHLKVKGAGSSTYQFTNPGLLDYFAHVNVLSTSYQYTSIEQMLIAANLVAAAQAGKANRYIGTSYVASGVTRSRKYNIADHKLFMDLLSEFPTLTDSVGNPTGFDIGMTHPGAQRLFTMWYPTRGSVRNDIVLEWGRNVTDYSVDEDGGGLATKTYCTGGSNGDIKFENHFSDEAAADIYGEWHAVINDTGENDVTTLLVRAVRYTARHNSPQVYPQVTAVEVPDTLLGVIHEGDWVVVRIKDGRYNINQLYRINDITWKPGPGNLQIGFVKQ